MSDDTGDRRPFTITCVRRNGGGFWTARVTADGQTLDVDRAPGSWRVTPTEPGATWRELLPRVALALQKRVRPLETRERRAGQDTTP